MLKAILRAALGGLAAGLVASAIAHFLFRSDDPAPQQRAAAGTDDLSEADQERLLRELESLT